MNKRQETKFAGDPITLLGEKATVGEKAPNFTVQDKDMNPVELKDFAGKTVIISVVPSIDTKVCAAADLSGHCVCKSGTW